MEAKVKKKAPNYERLPIVGKQPKDEKEEKFLREVCEFEFYNLEETGLVQKFAYGNAHHKENFVFFHGTKYKIPRHVARHLEEKSTPRYEWRPDGSGRMTKTKVGDKPRFQMRQTHG